MSSLKTKERLVESLASVKVSFMGIGCSTRIHGDFHNENILFRNDDVVAILDFENLRQGNAQEDLVIFVHIACCNSGFSKENLQKAKKFVGAYAAKRPDVNINIEAALSNCILRRIGSIELEERYLKDGNKGICDILQRDMEHMIYLVDNLKSVASKIQGACKVGACGKVVGDVVIGNVWK